jgi:hypothetical protein
MTTSPPNAGSWAFAAREEREHWRNARRWAADDLGLTPAERKAIRWRRTAAGLGRLNAATLDHPDRSGLVEIRVRPQLTPIEVARAVIHESFHAWQVLRGLVGARSEREARRYEADAWQRYLASRVFRGGLAKMPKARGGGEPGVGRRGKNAVPQENRIASPPTLADLGLDKKTSMIAH